MANIEHSRVEWLFQDGTRLVTDQYLGILHTVDMIDLESKFEVLETEVKEINTNKETLKKNLLDLIELQHILDKTRGFFQEVRGVAKCGLLISEASLAKSFYQRLVWTSPNVEPVDLSFQEWAESDISQE